MKLALAVLFASFVLHAQTQSEPKPVYGLGLFLEKSGVLLGRVNSEGWNFYKQFNYCNGSAAILKHCPAGFEMSVHDPKFFAEAAEDWLNKSPNVGYYLNTAKKSLKDALKQIETLRVNQEQTLAALNQEMNDIREQMNNSSDAEERARLQRVLDMKTQEYSATNGRFNQQIGEAQTLVKQMEERIAAYEPRLAEELEKVAKMHEKINVFTRQDTILSIDTTDKLHLFLLNWLLNGTTLENSPQFRTVNRETAELTINPLERKTLVHLHGRVGHNNGCTLRRDGVVVGNLFKLNAWYYTQEPNIFHVDYFYLLEPSQKKTSLTMNGCDHYSWHAQIMK